MHLDERDGSVGVADGLDDGLRRHEVSYTLGRGQVVLGSGDRGHLLVLESVQQVLSAVLLVAVLHYCSQCLCPRYLR